jgi:hypothetical protein
METKTRGEGSKRATLVSLATGLFLGGEEQGALGDGDTSDRGLKVPALLVVVLGPVLALGYIVFVPLAGMATLAMFIGRRLKGLLARPALAGPDQ